MSEAADKFHIDEYIPRGIPLTEVFLFCFVFKTGSHSVVASNSQKSSCLNLLSAGTTGVLHDTQPRKRKEEEEEGERR